MKKTDHKRVLDLCDAALEVAPDAREAFLDRECADDATLRRSVDSVLMAMGEVDGFLDVTPPTLGAARAGERIGNYELIEPLGEGGMGTVYLAERREADYDQRVAVKLVRGHLLARELIARFDAERQILASLNHPYIARLIDGGTTDDGIPYLVMEYVDGIPIDRYCDERSLSVEERLALIRKVAVAVQSAHQNLVVHRDLKPSNVLVTEDGIPKLLDFGIARLMRTDEGDSGQTTVFGSTALTPDYASPEQILDGKVTTASDVYSLGVLTYQLLTGERPYSITGSNQREMMRSIESVTVPRPSTRLQSPETAGRRATTPARLTRLLEGDLDTILLKALHREPERRYASVAAFADDLRRFSEGLPVEARGDSIGYRVRRFVGRHRLAVTAAGAMLVVLVGALALTATAYLRAERAREEASFRFDQVRSLAKTMMFDVYEDLEKLPGTNSAQERLAASAQEYLATLAEASESSPEVKLEAALGFTRLSSVLNRQSVASSESRELAESAGERALTLLTELSEEAPAPGTWRALGQLRSNRGVDLLYIANDVPAAREELSHALEAYREGERSAPDDLEMTVERLLTQRRIADSYKWSNDFTEAIARLDPLLEEIAELRAMHTDSPELLKVHADVAHLRGEALAFDERTEEAIEGYRDAIALYREHLERYGDDVQISNAMVITLWSLGNSQTALERYEQALANQNRAIEIVEVQVARDPQDRNAQRRLTIFQGSKAEAMLGLGQVDEAMELILGTNGWFEEQAAADDSPGSHRSVAVGYQITGNLYQQVGRMTEACDWWRRTLAKWEEIDARFGISEFDAEQPELLADQLAACQ